MKVSAAVDLCPEAFRERKGRRGGWEEARDEGEREKEDRSARGWRGMAEKGGEVEGEVEGERE